MNGAVVPFPLRHLRISREEGARVALRFFDTPISERAERAAELHIEDPETLLNVTEALFLRVETSPSDARDEASFLFDFLAKPNRPIGQFDEREYFLGEIALIAGGACRMLFRRDEARRWFARAESNFVLTENAAANIARLAYQKLALATEERRFEEVLEGAPLWAESFKRLGLADMALKCLFLEGNVLRETGEVLKAIAIFETICSEAEKVNNIRLLGMGFMTLAQFHRVAGDLKSALVCAQRSLPLLQKTENRVNLAKLRWCVGDILREQGNKRDALESYRSALRESEELGIRGDVAAIHLVLADLLLDVGMDRQAEWEVRAALPIIDEEQMVPEGYAALGLLRESLRRRQIDRTALREVHGYFPAG